MNKTSLFLFGLLALTATTFISCGDKVADPDALYQKYLKDDAARGTKVSECKLLSVDEQQKSQTCTIAFKADGDKEMKRHGGIKMEPLDLGKQK